MSKRNRDARKMLQGLLYDGNKMLESGTGTKQVYEFLKHKLEKDFQGGTWWKVNWKDNSRFVVTGKRYYKCPICRVAAVDYKGHCTCCDAMCSLKDLKISQQEETNEQERDLRLFGK